MPTANDCFIALAQHGRQHCKSNKRMPYPQFTIARLGNRIVQTFNGIQRKYRHLGGVIVRSLDRNSLISDLGTDLSGCPGYQAIQI